MPKRKYDDDDGRQIADLSELDSPRFTWRRRAGRAEEKGTALSSLTPKEARSVLMSALAAGLVVGAIFIAGAALVIGICLLIW